MIENTRIICYCENDVFAIWFYVKTGFTDEETINNAKKKIAIIKNFYKKIVKIKFDDRCFNI